MQKSTRPANPGDSRKWFLVDAKDQVLGRLAVMIANKLRAKDTPSFDPSVDAGAFVIVVNAALVKLTGKKETQKDYQRYSGYRDGLKHFTAATMRRLHPDRIIKEAVWGMLPKNTISCEFRRKQDVRFSHKPSCSHLSQVWRVELRPGVAGRR